jgi:hypothetical protein
MAAFFDAMRSAAIELRRPFVGLAGPVALVLLIELLAWGSRYRFASFGTRADASALLVAALVAYALGAPLGGPRRWGLERLAGAAVLLLPAAAAAALCGWAAVGNIQLEPNLRIGSRGAYLSVLGASAAGAVLGRLLVRASARLALVLPLALSLVASAVVLCGTSFRARASRLPFEQVAHHLTQIETVPAIDLHRDERSFDIGGSELSYVATGSECFVQYRNATESITPIAVHGGFARCPRFELRQSLEESFGVVIRGERVELVFSLKSGTLLPLQRIRPDAGALSLLPRLLQNRAQEARVIHSAPELQAPRTELKRVEKVQDFEIAQDASTQERCAVEVRQHGRVLTQFTEQFERWGDVIRLCVPLEVRRSTTFDVVLVRAEPRSSFGSSSLDGTSVRLFRHAGRDTGALMLTDVADRVSAPLPWLVASAVLACASLLLLSLAGLQLSTWLRWRGFERARHLGAGLIELADGRTAQVAAAERLEPGDVWIRGQTATSTRLQGNYRDAGAPPSLELEVRPDRRDLELEQARAKAMLASVAATGFALAAVSLMTAARLHGFV